MIYRKKRLTDVAKGGGFFLALGPPIGATLLAVVGVLSDLISQGFEADFLFALAEIIPFMAFFSYIVAGVPAFATGLVAGLVRGYLRHLGHCLLIGGVGCVLSIAFGEGLFTLLSSSENTAIFFGPLGFVSSTACAMFFRVKNIDSSGTQRTVGSANAAITAQSQAHD